MAWNPLDTYTIFFRMMCWGLLRATADISVVMMWTSPRDLNNLGNRDAILRAASLPFASPN